MQYFSKKRVLPVLVLILSSLVIFWQFPHIPLNLSYDEIEFAKLALTLKNQWLIFSPYATGHATPYFYLLLLSLKTFGINALGLRLPAALFGVANSVLIYFLFRESFEDGLAFLGASILITMHWVFQFARYSFEATYLLFWELLAIYALIRFRKTNQTWQLLILVVACVMAFYSYLPGRIFFLLPVGLLLFEKKYRHFGLILLITIGLLAIPLVKSSGSMENRIQELTYLNQPLGVFTKISYFWQNCSKNFWMFSVRGDLNGRHNYPGKPALNPLLGILFWSGLLLALKNWPKNKLYLGWFVLGILPTLFTLPNQNPHFLRTYTITVSTVYFMLLVLKQCSRAPKRWQYILIFLIVLSCIYEVRTYFKYQQTVFPRAFEKKPDDLKKLKGF